MSGPKEDASYYVSAHGVPQVTSPANEPSDLPQVHVRHFKEVPYVVVHGLMGEPVLDLTCTDALNLAMLLIQGAGAAQNRRIDRLAPQ